MSREAQTYSKILDKLQELDELSEYDLRISAIEIGVLDTFVNAVGGIYVGLFRV